MARFLLPSLETGVEMHARKGRRLGAAARLGAAVGLVLGLLGPSGAWAEPESETRELMDEIFAAFATLVTRADDAEGFKAPEERGAVLDTLRALDGRVRALDGHVGILNAAHRSARRSLSEDVAAATDAYAAGRYEGARFLIGQIAEDCFACHSKLPSRSRFDLGKELVASEAAQGLPIERRATLAVAARQFDTALALHEAYFRDRSHSAVQIALSGAFESYLKVALRVLDDRERVETNLAAFRARPDVPAYLGAELATWIETLREVASSPEPPAELEAGRRWIREAQLRTAYPGDRRGLVHFVMASRALHRYADTRPGDRRLLAETFYLLGVCEIHISPSLWVSEVESFLESAIRTAPETLYARQAYATLEAVWIEGYTGSGGTHVPLELERLLDSLRELIDAATPLVSGAGGQPE